MASCMVDRIIGYFPAPAGRAQRLKELSFPLLRLILSYYAEGCMASCMRDRIIGYFPAPAGRAPWRSAARRRARPCSPPRRPVVGCGHVSLLRGGWYGELYARPYDTVRSLAPPGPAASAARPRGSASRPSPGGATVISTESGSDASKTAV